MEENTIQAQDVPVANEPTQMVEPAQIQAIPALRGINAYFALGPGNGTLPQLYSYDTTLGQWRIAQANEIERMMVSLGVPVNVLNAMKSIRL